MSAGRWRWRGSVAIAIVVLAVAAGAALANLRLLGSAGEERLGHLRQGDPALLAPTRATTVPAFPAVPGTTTAAGDDHGGSGADESGPGRGRGRSGGSNDDD